MAASFLLVSFFILSTIISVSSLSTTLEPNEYSTHYVFRGHSHPKDSLEFLVLPDWLPENLDLDVIVVQPQTIEAPGPIKPLQGSRVIWVSEDIRFALPRPAGWNVVTVSVHGTNSDLPNSTLARIAALDAYVRLQDGTFNTDSNGKFVFRPETATFFFEAVGGRFLKDRISLPKGSFNIPSKFIPKISGGLAIQDGKLLLNAEIEGRLVIRDIFQEPRFNLTQFANGTLDSNIGYRLLFNATGPFPPNIPHGPKTP